MVAILFVVTSLYEQVKAPWYLDGMHRIIVSEYDQEIPQSQTGDKPITA